MAKVRGITPRKQERRDRILGCARQQVARLGYDGVNMRDLTIAVDVSTATLYNLYKSMDELILAAVQELLRDISVLIEHQRIGRDHLMARYVVTADVIVENPRYADGMGKMLLAAEPSAPIVGQLIPVACHEVMNDREAMQGQGGPNESADVERLVREVAANAWVSIDVDERLHRPK